MINKLDDISLIISLIQVLLGGFVFLIFRTWLLKDDELTKTVILKKERKYEEICEATQNMLNRAIYEDIPLRGNNGEYPDVVLSFSKKVVENSNYFLWLKQNQKSIIALNNFIICTSFLGVLFLIVIQFIESHFYIISLASIIIILSQIIVFLVIRYKGIKLNKFEDL